VKGEYSDSNLFRVANDHNTGIILYRGLSEGLACPKAISLTHSSHLQLNSTGPRKPHLSNSLSDNSFTQQQNPCAMLLEALQVEVASPFVERSSMFMVVAYGTNQRALTHFHQVGHTQTLCRCCQLCSTHSH